MRFSATSSLTFTSMLAGLSIRCLGDAGLHFRGKPVVHQLVGKLLIAVARSHDHDVHATGLTFLRVGPGKGQRRTLEAAPCKPTNGRGNDLFLVHQLSQFRRTGIEGDDVVGMFADLGNRAREVAAIAALGLVQHHQGQGPLGAGDVGQRHSAGHVLAQEVIPAFDLDQVFPVNDGAGVECVADRHIVTDRILCRRVEPVETRQFGCVQLLQKPLLGQAQCIVGGNDGHVDDRVGRIGFDLGHPLDAVAGLDDEFTAADFLEGIVERFLVGILGEGIDRDGQFFLRGGAGGNQRSAEREYGQFPIHGDVS